MIRSRATTPEDLPALDELFRARFGHPLTPEEWEWKYRRLPGEARSRVAVDEGGRVLAHAGALRFPARLAPSPAPSRADGIWQLTDWVAAAAGAGLRPPLVGLGRDLLADLPRPGDAPWIFGFPSARHFRLGQRVFGYRPLPAIMPLQGPIPPTPPSLSPGPSAAGAVVEVGDLCGEWAEVAWDSCGVRGVRRSVAFLNWRYHARPDRYYRVYRLRPTGAADAARDGLAVFAFVGSLARGTELWLPPVPGGDPGPEGAWRAALEAVAADLRAAGLERWELWPPPPGGAGRGLAAELADLGLTPSGEPLVMGCRARGASLEGPSPEDPGFYYAMGDYDLA